MVLIKKNKSWEKGSGMNVFRLSIVVILFGTVSSVWAKGGYIYEYAGDVKVAVAGSAARNATQSMPLDDNSVITTGDRSRAVLKFEDGQLIVLRSNTTFQIKKYVFDTNRSEKNSAFFSLFKGGLRAVTGLIGKHNKQAFKLSTPTTTVGIRGTDFMLQTEGKAMYAQVTEGAVTMLTAKSDQVFTAGQSSFVPFPTASPVLASAPALTFIQLQVIATPTPTPAPAPKPGTAVPPPTAQTLTSLAKSIKTPGVKPADIATAMIDVGNRPAVVTTGVINFAPQAAASVTTATVAAAPQDAAAITSAAVTAAPTQAAAITTAAVTVAQPQAAAITTAAVAAAPTQASAITAAAITAAPTQAAAITTAAVTAAPTQAAVITTAAVTAAPTEAVAITEAAVTAAPTEAAAITEAAVTAAPSQSVEIINAVEPVAPVPETIVVPPPTGGGAASPN